MIIEIKKCFSFHRESTHSQVTIREPSQKSKMTREYLKLRQNATQKRAEIRFTKKTAIITWHKDRAEDCGSFAGSIEEFGGVFGRRCHG